MELLTPEYTLILILIGLLFFKEQLMGLIAKKFNIKMNGSSNQGIKSRVDEIADNHLHEVVNILTEIKDDQKDNHRELVAKINEVNNGITFIKAKLTNGKN